MSRTPQSISITSFSSDVCLDMHFRNLTCPLTHCLLLPSVKKIQVLKGLTETKAHETETVTFEVELSQADVEGSWTRDGAKFKAGANFRITALGKKHALTLSNLKREDAGTICFQAEGVRSSGKLIITGKSCFLPHWGGGGSVQRPFRHKRYRPVSIEHVC